MNDVEFLHALESCTLPPSQFNHAAHVRAGYLYLRGNDFAQGLQRMRDSVRAYAASLGSADKYHETITVAFMALIHRHLYERGDGGGWERFAQANPELLDARLLLQFFPKSLLDSPVARHVFVLPTIPAGA